MTMDEHIHRQDVRCPWCGKFMDCHTYIGTGSEGADDLEQKNANWAPNAGSLAICLYCQNVSEFRVQPFTTDLRLEKLPPNEIPKSLHRAITLTRSIVNKRRN